VKKWANELNRPSLKEELQMAKKHMKKCSTSLATKEMQIKTTLRFYLTLVRRDTIKSTAIPLLGIYQKDCELAYNKSICTTMFIAALFTVAELWKQPSCPTTEEWIKKCGNYIQWNFAQP
jgi:hypothetical protein